MQRGEIMAKKSNREIFLNDYQAPAYLIDSVELDFELNPKKTKVYSRIKFRKNPNPNSSKKFFLNGEKLNLINAKIDGKVVQPELVENGLECDVPSEPFIWESLVEIDPSSNTSLEGLYISNDMYCTQCEAEGFRKICYYPDRPDVLAPFVVSIRGSSPVLLSNGNPISIKEGYAKWSDPWPKPAYLFALVAGDLLKVSDKFRTKTGDNIDLNIYVRKGDEDKCDFAITSLKQAMQWDEERYGRVYDLEVFNIVAVDDFNMGAMENKGLNIFNSKCVLTHPRKSTDKDFEYVEGIIAHEYFHNWTGNRITCRDWFQLCLKEGLTVFRDAQFTADLRDPSVKRIKDAKVIKGPQFREDASPLAHPVRPESFVEINNFYTLTVYEKGAELIGMLKLLVGDREYYSALELYFKRHDGQAATIEDWIKVFEDVTNRDLTQFKLWYSQAGTPKVKFNERYSGETLKLDFEQVHDCGQKEKSKPMLIPISIGLLDENGTDLIKTTVFELNKPKDTIVFKGIYKKPTVSLLRNFSAPVIIERVLTDKDSLNLLEKDSDPYNRWDAAQQLMLTSIEKIAIKGREPSNDLINAFCNIMQDEKLMPAVRAQMLSQPSISELVTHFFEKNLKIDPLQIYKAKKLFAKKLAETSNSFLKQLFHSLAQNFEYEPSANQSGERSLKNFLLGLLTKLDNGESARKQCFEADNMTDEVEALSILIQNDMAVKEIENFYHKWSDDRLVIDKWFMLQTSLSPPSKSLQIAKSLTNHSDFNEKNPNRFRATIGGFSQNLAAFHTQDGAGYKFVGGWIKKIDCLNPQLAAKTCTAFQNMKQFDDLRQEKMSFELTNLIEVNTLSKDTTEMISRMLSK